MASGNGLAAMRATWIKTQIAGRVSARLAGRQASRLWFTPWRLPEGEGARARREQWLEGTRPLTVPAGRFELKGFEAGDGPLVLLVHGWADRASSLGGFVKPLVDDGYRVVGLDLPGHGDTSEGQTDGYELGEALLEAAWHLGEVHGIIAHSMGSLATMLALRDGLRVDSVVLISPAVRLERGLSHFLKMYKLPDRVGRGLRNEIERRYGDSVWDEIAVDGIARDLEVRALIIHDVKDEQISVEDSQMLAAAWPTARLQITAGLGHNRILRDADVVQRATAFLQETLVPV